jgi:hypothetical protein
MAGIFVVTYQVRVSATMRCRRWIFDVLRNAEHLDDAGQHLISAKR